MTFIFIRTTGKIPFWLLRRELYACLSASSGESCHLCFAGCAGCSQDLCAPARQKVCCRNVKILHLFELFRHFNEFRQTAAMPYYWSVLPSIMNECTEVLFNVVLFLFFNSVLEATPHLPLRKSHCWTVNEQKCILPPGVRGNVSQTQRPANGLQGQIFLPLLDSVPTPGKRPLADTQAWLSTCAPSASVTPVPCSQLQLRWLASIFPPVPSPLHLHLSSLNANPRASQPAEASWSWGFSSTSMLSEPRLCKVWTEMRAVWGAARFDDRFSIIIYWPLQKLRGQ